jgi:hypothetical protein
VSDRVSAVAADKAFDTNPDVMAGHDDRMYGTSLLPDRHCERSEAIQNLSAEAVWIASLRSQ